MKELLRHRVDHSNSANANQSDMGLPVHTSRPPPSTSTGTGEPTIDPILSMIQSLDTSQLAEFHKTLLGRMTTPAKEGVCEILWSSANESGFEIPFDMPSRNRIYDDAGIQSLLRDEEPTEPPIVLPTSSTLTIASTDIDTDSDEPQGGVPGSSVGPRRLSETTSHRRRHFGI